MDEERGPESRKRGERVKRREMKRKKWGEGREEGNGKGRTKKKENRRGKGEMGEERGNSGMIDKESRVCTCVSPHTVLHDSTNADLGQFGCLSNNFLLQFSFCLLSLHHCLLHA